MADVVSKDYWRTQIHTSTDVDYNELKDEEDWDPRGQTGMWDDWSHIRGDCSEQQEPSQKGKREFDWGHPHNNEVRKSVKSERMNSCMGSIIFWNWKMTAILQDGWWLFLSEPRMGSARDVMVYEFYNGCLLARGFTRGRKGLDAVLLTFLRCSSSLSHCRIVKNTLKSPLVWVSQLSLDRD